MQRFRGGLVFKAHRLSYHSNKGEEEAPREGLEGAVQRRRVSRELGTYKTVEARFGPWLREKSSQPLELFPSSDEGRAPCEGLEGLVFKAHRLVYHSTLGLRVIKEKKKRRD